VNPYTLLLAESLRRIPGVVVLNFTWRTALFGRYDVFHVHWPEILVDGHSPLKRFVRQVFTLLFVARLAITRTPIVRTVHNIGLPTDIGWRQRRLLELIERRTTLRIRINSTTALPGSSPSATIPHGHFREWYSHHIPSDPVPGRFGYFGRIRRYKGVEALIEEFRAADDRTLSLRLGGYPSTPELAAGIAGLAEGDPRITFQFGFLSDAELVEIVTTSELVVLPYPQMHNSGSVLATLSLDRPLLVPDNRVNRLLSDEVGPGWVHTFTGTLSPDALVSALRSLREHPPTARPRLDAREWDDAAQAHLDAYRAAIAVLRPRSAR
jgi:glycosyltransferase involved in cell wall biosynthesis